MYTLKKLIDKTYQELLDSGLSNKTVYSANWYIWNRLVRIHGDDAIFEENMIYKYCFKYFKKDIFKTNRTDLSTNEKRYIIAFARLSQSSKDIPFKKCEKFIKAQKKLSSNSSKILDEYINNCINDGNSENTINNKYERIKKFMIVIDFDNISVEKCIQYLNSEKARTSNIEYIIRMRLIRKFLIFCYSRQVISKEIIIVWPDTFSMNYGKNIPSVYSTDEIKSLLDAAKKYKCEDNHLRNYAILVLLAYSGIRISDVTNLKLGDINWRENTIMFVQHKTKRSHSIPLIPEIGNSIIEYIINERHKGSSYLFTKENGDHMTSASITTVINNYFCISPIDIGERHYGPHALRHSIATNLINKSVDLFSVANVLGHSSIDCVNVYAKVDLNNLKKCVLEAPYICEN